MMEISTSTQAPITPPVREPQPVGKLATLRTLQKAIEAERQEVEKTHFQQEGKGQLLDITC